jgi:hypothetical protein
MKALADAKAHLNSLRSQWAELEKRRLAILLEIRETVKRVERLSREAHKAWKLKMKRAKAKAKITNKRNRLKRILEMDAKGYHIWKIAAKLDVTTNQATRLLKRAKETFNHQGNP